MPSIAKSMIIGGLAVLALSGCKQENNYPATSVTTEATTAIVVPGPTSTVGVAVPVPGPTVTETASSTATTTP